MKVVFSGRSYHDKGDYMIILIERILACHSLTEIFINFWLVGFFIVIEGFCIYILLRKEEQGGQTYERKRI